MKKKKFPTFKTDREAEEFVATADLTEYDFSGMRYMRFVFVPKSKRVSKKKPRLNRK